MKIYVIRHGQPLAREFIGGDNRFPAYDVPLTELGREQARAAGRRLKELGFHGIIYVSPFRRTLDTATAIAEELGLTGTVLEGIREISRGSTTFVGMTKEEIEAEFPLMSVPQLSYPWWTIEEESMDDVQARVDPTMDEVLGDRTGPDVLFVGHGASTYACRRYLGLKTYCQPHGDWNASLSMLDTETGEEYICDTSYLTDDLITNNRKTLADVLAEREEAKKAEAAQ